MSDAGFDVNATVAHFLNQRFDSILQSALSLTGIVDAKKKKEARSHFQSYLTRDARRLSRIPQLLNRGGETFLYDYYIPMPIKNTKTGMVLVDPNAETLLESSRCNIVIGTGGSGKTIFLRHLFINAIQRTEYMPVYVEFRKKDYQAIGLVDAVADVIQLSSDGQSWLESLLNEGKLLILLDGFDEVDKRHRKKVWEEIETLSTKYQKLRIVVSTRPGYDFQTLTEYTVQEMQGLPKEKAVALVRRLDATPEDKNSFVSGIENGKYDSYSDFLLWPMLLTIMFLTYCDNASIPVKKHLFYRSAYDALWNKHDAISKGNWEGPRQTGLDQEEFRKVFQGFSILTLTYNESSYDQSLLLERMKKAIEMVGMNVDAQGMIDDLLRVVCLLQRDGSQYEYQHKTFQEYFASRFLVESEPAVRVGILQTYFPTPTGSVVWNFLHEIMPDQFAVEMLLPFLELHLGDVEESDSCTDEDVYRFVISVYGNSALRLGPAPPHTLVKLGLDNDGVDYKQLWYPFTDKYAILEYIYDQYDLGRPRIGLVEEYKNVHELLSDMAAEFPRGQGQISDEMASRHLGNLVGALSYGPVSPVQYAKCIELRNKLRETKKRLESIKDFFS